MGEPQVRLLNMYLISVTFSDYTHAKHSFDTDPVATPRLSLPPSPDPGNPLLVSRRCKLPLKGCSFFLPISIIT